MSFFRFGWGAGRFEARSASAKREAEWGSHSPLGDRQARLSGVERANHGVKRSYPLCRKRTCRQRSQSELGKFAKGKRWTPVPTKDTLHFSKNML